MKRHFEALAIAAVLLFTFTLSARADDLQATINAAQQALNAHVEKREEMTKEWPTFETRKSNIEFAYNALVKQAPIVEQEINQIESQQRAIDAKYDDLKPRIEQLDAAGNRHNSIHCTEQCDENGHCDGSCAWYNAEKAQLEQQQAAINQQIQSVNSENQQLDSQRQTVKKSAQELVQIQNQVSADTVQWTADVKQFKADWDENERQIQVLTDTLARLNQIKSQVDGCMRSIPAECDAPDTPLLVTKCERMHAECGRMFDGN